MEMIRNLRFYNSGNLATLKSGKGAVTIFRNQDALFAEQLTDSAIDVKLLSTDNHKSVINTKNRNGQELFSYTPYGYCQVIPWSSTASGFNGEYLDPATDNYMLGNGYRACSPRQRRFICTDSESPFGIGGLNAYAYCLCDPINNIDPDGHWTLNPFKIARHVARSITGSHTKHFEGKFSESIKAASSTIERIERPLITAAEKLPALANKANASYKLEDRFNLNFHTLAPAINKEKFLPVAAKHIKEARHHNRNITRHHSDPAATSQRDDQIKQLQTKYNDLYFPLREPISHVANIRN